MTTRGTVPAGSARAADRRARRMSPQQRRDHLIATALQLYSRRHPEDVSIDDIVAAADVSRALFYRYFTNLREVHLAALGRVVDDLIARAARGSDGVRSAMSQPERRRGHPTRGTRMAVLVSPHGHLRVRRERLEAKRRGE